MILINKNFENCGLNLEVKLKFKDVHFEDVIIILKNDTWEIQ